MLRDKANQLDLSLKERNLEIEALMQEKSMGFDKMGKEIENGSNIIAEYSKTI